MFTRVYTVWVSVRDQRAAIDFYTNKLGMTLIMDEPNGYPGEGENTNWVEVAPAGTQTSIALGPPMGTEPGGPAPLLLRCADAEATCAELKARGVEVTKEVSTEFWGTNFQFKDPDGNEYIVTQEQ